MKNVQENKEEYTLASVLRDTVNTRLSVGYQNLENSKIFSQMAGTEGKPSKLRQFLTALFLAGSMSPIGSMLLPSNAHASATVIGNPQQTVKEQAAIDEQKLKKELKQEKKKDKPKDKPKDKFKNDADEIFYSLTQHTNEIVEESMKRCDYDSAFKRLDWQTTFLSQNPQYLSGLSGRDSLDKNLAKDADSRRAVVQKEATDVQGSVLLQDEISKTVAETDWTALLRKGDYDSYKAQLKDLDENITLYAISIKKFKCQTNTQNAESANRIYQDKEARFKQELNAVSSAKAWIAKKENVGIYSRLSSGNYSESDLKAVGEFLSGVEKVIKNADLQNETLISLYQNMNEQYSQAKGQPAEKGAKKKPMVNILEKKGSVPTLDERIEFVKAATPRKLAAEHYLQVAEGYAGDRKFDTASKFYSKALRTFSDDEWSLWPGLKEKIGKSIATNKDHLQEVYREYKNKRNNEGAYSPIEFETGVFRREYTGKTRAELQGGVARLGLLYGAKPCGKLVCGMAAGFEAEMEKATGKVPDVADITRADKVQLEGFIGLNGLGEKTDKLGTEFSRRVIIAGGLHYARDGYTVGFPNSRTETVFKGEEVGPMGLMRYTGADLGWDLRVLGLTKKGNNELARNGRVIYSEGFKDSGTEVRFKFRYTPFDRLSIVGGYKHKECLSGLNKGSADFMSVEIPVRVYNQFSVAPYLEHGSLERGRSREMGIKIQYPARNNLH